jgi:hypothetical protein
MPNVELDDLFSRGRYGSAISGAGFFFYAMARRNQLPQLASMAQLNVT